MIIEFLIIITALLALAAIVAVMTVLTSKRRDIFVRVNFDAEKTRELGERYMIKAR